jgi:hypothetical protein|tara:strand:- start:841 stop:1098 length:258 start_codon:yes stop_codon:yes gene_type:complete
MNRKQRRAADRNRKKNDPKQLMADKVHMFGELPEKCNACQNSFDKRNRDMVFSWRVVVRGETVRLFCPDCLKKVEEAINECAKAV